MQTVGRADPSPNARDISAPQDGRSHDPLSQLPALLRAETQDPKKDSGLPVPGPAAPHCTAAAQETLSQPPGPQPGHCVRVGPTVWNPGAWHPALPRRLALRSQPARAL